jgi:Family of unknown function (DUF6348)
MERRGYAVTRHDTWLEHPASGLTITPLLLESHPSETLVRSVSTVATSHPRLIPDGVFEYQHSVGRTLSEAVRDGFDQWVQLDFVVFLDALRDKTERCGTIEIAFPQKDGCVLSRRAVLGPIGHSVAQPEHVSSDIAHPFCSCCFFTNTYPAFQPLFEAGFYAIRLYTVRKQEGSVKADCRVNGEDWESGEYALCNYAETWPQMGFEIRKQYVVLQTLSASGWPSNSDACLGLRIANSG